VKARSMAIQGGLALVGLVAAYTTWQRPKDTRKAETVLILSASKQSLEKVRFDDGARFVEVSKVTESEPRLWTSLETAEELGKDLKARLEMTQTVASERADALFARFQPFDATRALGAQPTAKLDELGLVGSERHLVVTVSGQAHRFLVSKPAHGLIGTYVQDEKSQEVYLVQSSIFSDLDPASQLLVDRRLHTFKQADVERFTVTFEGKTVEYVQQDASVPATTKVARASQPDKPDEMAKNWHDKVWNRLVVTEVLGQGEQPKAGAPNVGLRLEYAGRGGSGGKKGWLELGLDPKQGVWARSENTAGWVGVHQGTEETMLEAKRLVE